MFVPLDFSRHPALSFYTLLTAQFVHGNAVHLIVSGQYVTQQYVWRNAPIGIDVSTLLLGNPFHALWGSVSRHMYGQLGIDLIESGAWLGVAPFLLAALALRGRWAHPIVRQWFLLGSIFLVWALGSHVHAAGHNTGLIVPEVLLRYVPIAANARMPGRAMVVVYLSLAVLAAMGIPQFGRRRRSCVQSGASLAFLQFLDRAVSDGRLSVPQLSVLRDRLSQALSLSCRGLGDGFGRSQLVDHRVLVCQSFRRPLVGGCHELPSNVPSARRPLIAAWLRLSGARWTWSSRPVRRTLPGNGWCWTIQFVMLQSTKLLNSCGTTSSVCCP
jgi:hypothetical protein